MKEICGESIVLIRLLHFVKKFGSRNEFTENRTELADTLQIVIPDAILAWPMNKTDRSGMIHVK